ncbi:beta-glucuronidase [Dysgonomonas sp. PFB1-18]|uniref:glycoside hydrolase family 2 protein n=1 Tax=unclassified Dysgonomonas TaxID=2630389 RepID=UPI002474828F|nr:MULTISPECIES: glycoside hydrolase family 2 TIM barrel-domain containing protein [unclassified Dysgonomonas]MDH6309542.1 beta-glucuronidase [Dysgonomonas sp. PF1-14]MDH6339130.1 beta-glucuronidase [Dysgonomonas sp. PF1-16]MDH6380584.1 beta-glucuronidase [Dysgonomonas sp. PFB1-18]MDH6398080.1 beta-glucuronidase [Dysgonomonas sp. PF1-23]
MRLKSKLLVFAVLFCNLLAFGQTTQGLDPLVQNVYNRHRISLNGYWHYVVDPLETGYYDYRRMPNPDGFFKDHQVDNVSTWKEYDFDTAPVMPVPGDWNTHSDNLFLYEGTIWFRQQFLYTPKSGNKVYLYFGASNYDTKIYLNGTKVGEHEGGYTPFNFDVTDIVKSGNNKLVVKVDNKRRADAVPTNNFDWFNYGGITRDVMLVELPQTFIQSYKVQLKKGTTNTLELKARMSAKTAGQTVTIEIPELKIKQTLTTDASGMASVEVKATPSLWSPESPKLYDVLVSSATDKVNDEIGFRTIETRGREIFLNGKQIFMKGISIHEEAAFRNGRIFSEDEDRTLLNWAKDLGCNYVRLAHYPHNEQMVRLAEKMGLLVWSEIPVYWTIHWEKDYVYANALNQLDEMIERDQNRANIFVWSIANETPHSDPRDKFLSSLAKYAREKDNTRLISMAMERKDKSKEILSINDNMSEYVDIISVNQYVGWYDGTNEKLDRVKWEVDYEKPLMISEFGGEAVFGHHGDVSQIWTEEYQAELYRKTLRMIDERMPYVSGISPWILKDFRSSRRLLPNVQDGFNRKGVISDRGDRKLAFYVLQEWFKKK